ncbi:hypothetical protein [Mucilaginibacter boryungensis]|uniref:Lipoprotein n=1 Tax=Mucilaginibacter boryungensis TaxID=768480 RepID=A0ABR9XKU5_9SPHI|nr:hypothetical protein [Mucilaginibacter boryungensis]MBE9668037.1 hypothetical protein [Mucilaginibacter boryungensis]
MLTRLKFIGLAGLLIVGLACKKNDTSTALTGKIIIARCGTIVIQIDGAAGNGGGTAWTNAGATYTNAATIGNYCYLSGLGIKAGDNVSFKVVKENPQPNASCITEYCLASGPSARIYVTDVVKTGP